VSLLYYANA